MTQPKFRRVAAELMRKIDAGELAAGTKMPSDLDLCEEYRESRSTIRDALSWLALRELVERRPGQGTFVTRRVRPIVTTLSQDPETGRAGGDASSAYAEYLGFLERRRQEAHGTGLAGTESEGPHLDAVPHNSGTFLDEPTGPARDS